jgi:hypothetical protein
MMRKLTALDNERCARGAARNRQGASRAAPGGHAGRPWVPPRTVFAAVTAKAGRLMSADLTVLRRYEPDGVVTSVGVWIRTGQAPLIPLPAVPSQVGAPVVRASMLIATVAATLILSDRAAPGGRLRP